MVNKFHPNLKENYFERIDTKEKAYWLGFLYADGYMETRNAKPFRIGLEIGLDEEFIIDRFIQTLGLNAEAKRYIKRSNTVLIRFANKTIVKDLVNHGVVPKKSKIIELPDLENRELYLAFLLGFFDGDGKVGTTRIVTGSRIFLEQIKNKFLLPNKIYEKQSPGYFGDKLIGGHGFSMSLGVGLFREMLSNYQNSLPRKRHIPTQSERIEKIKKSTDSPKKRKFLISKEELTELIWKMPMKKIGSIYNVNEKTVKYWCIKWNIKIPPFGYWNKNHNKES